MALKNICLLPHGCDLEFLRLHNCRDGSHAHISARQLRKYESDKIVEVIARGDSRTVAVRLSCYRGGTKISPRPQLRGSSCQLGEYLSIAIVIERQRLRKNLVGRKDWALVMYADIRRRHELPAAEAAA